jgi:acetolactate synthase-1/2/3 large subunit
MYTASSAFLDALSEAGITHIFANWGSDHPALIEALAEARAHGRPTPRVITCPNEMVALSAAHGFAQVTGQPQAVIVHVECGTQALAGAVHNADKGRIPILIFAGSSPFTQAGELKGSRNEFIQWIQDVHDQRGIVRGYMRYDNEIRTGRNIKQLVHRALQFANSDPKGPVYLMGAREVMEEEVAPAPTNTAAWAPIAPCALPEGAAENIAAALAAARRPLIVTSYLGRRPEAVPELVRLAKAAGAGVLESVPNYVNFPASNPLYLGNQWNRPVQNEDLAAADLVLVIDSDVPWIPTVSHPSPSARIIHIDIDPLKQQMPLWYIGATATYRADATTALRQITAALSATPPSPAALAERTAHYTARHETRRAVLAKLEQNHGQTDAITGEFICATLRRHLDDSTIIISEGISHYHTIGDHLALDRPGALFTSGGGSLGYHGGAAIGAKLARPDSTIIALTGDGSYMFSVPSSVHWIARAYATPFLTIIFNNRGWKSPKLSTLAVHPHGYASRANSLDVSFEPPPDHAAIAAAAGGAYAATIRRPEDFEPALIQALLEIRSKNRAAVLDVWVPQL